MGIWYSWGYFKMYYALKGFWLEIWHIIIILTKICSWTFENLYIGFKHIDAITDSTNMIFKEKNGSAIIMKYYAKWEISVWCISMKGFRIMSSGDLKSVSRG